ncbi:MAG: ASKHA domain-containing protein [Desulfobacteraceae bacterium]|jgi:uncharacterized 2Fe-2S/4Fe-4S cluster protein (DUF4445 family)|nr:ASKHA domain-containing protein [Desulfobacteraceae bacterium]
MGQCLCHPEKDTPYLCMKDNVYLCDECLHCRNPEIYCKFRPSCPIWFMEKRGFNDTEQEGEKTISVTFLPDGKAIEVPVGTNLLEAARQAEVHLNASCNGRGACGKCKLIVARGTVNTQTTTLLTEREKAANYVLACQTTVTEDITVQIPPEAIERKLKVAGMGEEVTSKLLGRVTEIDPMVVEVPLELAVPTLDDPVSDLDRLYRGLRKAKVQTHRMSVGLKVMRELAAAMRDENWKVTASILRRRHIEELIEVAPGNGRGASLGLAIDVGTTTVVVYLVDMEDGRVVAATSGHNRQASCGDDVINRIVCAEKNGVRKLSRMALATINDLVEEAAAAAGAQRDRIKNVAIAGNTTMVHLLLGIEPRYIRREPYLPTVSEFPIIKAGEVGLKTHPGAAVFVYPGPASYVGGDIVSGMIYSGQHREAPMTLFIDIGTNGEIVLGNNELLMTASCSAGPAFEGGGVRWGMRAEEGAIEKVNIDPQTRTAGYETIGDLPPRGICGSGMIDLISEMLVTGVIDPRGRIALDESHPCIVRQDDVLAYRVAPAAETAMGEDLLFSETDIHSLVLSKAAVYAGFTTLLEQAGMDFSAVDRVWISGGFGQYLNFDRAISIGLLPDIARDKFTYLGNSSIAGAYMALLSGKLRAEARQVSNAMTYIDFSSNARFMDEFTSAQFLPHTDMNAFPSVKIGRPS